LDLQEATGEQLGMTAHAQSKRLDKLLGTPLQASDIAYRKPGEVPNAPTLAGLPQQWRPDLQVNLPGQNFLTRYESGGGILDKYDRGGRITTTFDNANNLLNTYDPGFDIQQSVGDDDFEAARHRVEQALFSRLDPQIERDREAMFTRLANQGITQGSEAWRNSIDDFQRGVNDLRMQAILAGGQEQSRLFGMDVTQGQFANQAQAQQYAQNQALADFYNRAQAQLYAQNLGLGQFENQAQAQQYAQNQALAEFFNQATAQREERNAARAAFANQGTAQQAQFDLSQAGFENQARQQMAQNVLTERDYNNNIAQQNWQLALNQIQNQTALRQQALQELVALRNQPIAETTALMGGSAPTIPQFQPWNAPTLARTPVAESVYNSAALANEQYKMQMAQYNAGLGGMYGLGGSLLSGIFAKSDRRLKQDIKRVGTLDNGIPIYIYKWKQRPWDKYEMGVLADEVEKIHPDAVLKFKNVRYVNYERAVQPVDKEAA
jgi:hypothetical protein